MNYFQECIKNEECPLPQFGYEEIKPESVQEALRHLRGTPEFEIDRKSVV